MAIFLMRLFNEWCSLDGTIYDQLPTDAIVLNAALTGDDWHFAMPARSSSVSVQMAEVAGLAASTDALPGSTTGGPILVGPIMLNSAASYDSSDQAVDGPQARSTYNVTGAGVTIGVLSDSFNLHGGEAQAQANGYLPATINILKEGPTGSSDEGQAMAEIIHSIAPGAAIDFYTAFDSEADFGAGITALVNAGAQIIVDDVFYLDEPFYQDAGPITLAAQQAVADGVDYFAAAGNYANNYYEADFNAVSDVSLPGIATPQTVHEVSNGGTMTPYIEVGIAAGSTVDLLLEWAQPYASSGGGSGSAYGLAVAFYDSNFNLLHVSYTSNPIGADPVVYDSFTNTSSSSTIYMVFIDDAGVATPGQFKILFADNGGVITGPLFGGGSGSVFGHTEAPGVNAVGAINVANAPNGAPEYFTSSGPGEILYNTAGNLLATPIDPAAPEFLGPDGSQTTIYNPFDGTSAAAPAAAAVAALMLQADPTLTPAQVTATLEHTATPDGNEPTTIAGAGLINADAAVAAVATVACYLRRTRIATPQGPRAIEDLRVGDHVVTLAGQARPIRWIARRSYARPFAGASVQPIRFAPNSLAPGVPERALYVSADHAMFSDGYLIPAECLVNGTTICHVEYDRLEYLHLELDSHDVIFAEGAASETYCDTGNRWMFENAGECPAPPRPTAAFAPRLDRFPTGELTDAADVHLRAAGAVFAPVGVDGSIFRFVLPYVPSLSIIELRSNGAVPARLGIGQDARRLGIAVHEILFRVGTACVRMAPGDAALLGGFHKPEPELCWTDGQAHIRIPDLLCAGGSAPETEMSIILRATPLPAYPAISAIQ